MSTNKRMEIDFFDIYEKKMNKKNFCIVLVVIIFLIVLSAYLDACPKAYICEQIEYIFKRDKSDFPIIGTQILALWAATNSLIIFYLGRVKDEYFGIKIVDSFRVKFPILQCFIYIIADVFILAISFWAILYQREIVATLCEMIQFLNLIFVIIIARMELSRKTIQSRLVMETVERMKNYKAADKEQNILGPLCIAMLKNCDDESYFRVITNGVTEITKKFGESYDNEQENNTVFEFSFQFANNILLNSNDKNKVTALFQEMLVDLNLDGTIYFCVRKGIVRTVLDNILNPLCPGLDKIIGIDYSQLSDIQYWGFVYNSYARMDSEKYYRRYIAKEIVSFFDVENEIDKRKIFNLWLEFVAKEKQSNEIDYHFKHLRNILNEIQGGY